MKCNKETKEEIIEFYGQCLDCERESRKNMNDIQPYTNLLPLLEMFQKLLGKAWKENI